MKKKKKRKEIIFNPSQTMKIYIEQRNILIVYTHLEHFFTVVSKYLKQHT